MSFEPSKMSTIIPKQKASWLVPHTVDGSFEILHQLRLVVYPIISRVLCIPGGAGFLPSTVCF